ncbi:MAG: DUF349 domain-containing protein [Prolixibacteraceae bacterium]|jgi:hypothetical protein|nr:DUF349 domain-containing protein [Prolixibacteraceae bacterium]
MEPKDKMYSETQDEVTRSGMQPEDVNEDAAQTAEKEVLDESPAIETEPEQAEVKNIEAETESTAAAEIDAPAEPITEIVADVTEIVDEVSAETANNIASSETNNNDEAVEKEAAEEKTVENEVVEEKVEEQQAAENEVLAEAETENNVNEKQHEPEVDYSKLSEVELINALKDLLENREFMEIYPQVDAIKINFYKKHKLKIQEQKKNFIAEGGYEEEFKAEPDPYEEDLKALMALYRQKKFQYNKLFEAEKEENLKRKYEIIEEIKGLVNRKESINKTFQEFKELQQQWREIGLVPQANVKDMWENYHHHVENFYDYIKINKELRDLDLKKNLDEKIILCEKAEALLIEPSVIKAFNALQKLHDGWREVGPVPTDKKEEIWERFKDATNAINKKHQDFFDNRKKAQKKNLDAKAALCEKVEDIINSSIETHKEWEAKSKEIIELQKYWRTIGFAPKKDNNAIYERFRTACDRFFDMKREFYSKHKEIQSNNLQLKIDLCIQAEALKDSTDWKKTTEEYIAIQKKWKEVGPVPRKHSDNVWKRFRAACDSFFERKSKFFNNVDESQVENLKLKKELIDEVNNFKPSGKDSSDLEKLRTFQRRWTDIGHVPIANKNEVQKQFRDAINVQFDKLRVDDRDRNLLRFKSKVTDWKDTSKGHNKAYAERDKYVSKLRQLESDLITLQNNIGFFSNSKNAEALIKDVERKIQNNEEQIAYLKEKINIIDELDNQKE